MTDILKIFPNLPLYDDCTYCVNVDTKNMVAIELMKNGEIGKTKVIYLGEEFDVERIEPLVIKALVRLKGIMDYFGSVEKAREIVGEKGMQLSEPWKYNIVK